MIDDGISPLKEHTNGVKPSAPVSLFGNAGTTIPALVPSVFNFGAPADPSPLKPFGAPQKNAENEENVPQAAPAGKEVEPPKATASIFNFGGAPAATTSATSTGLFSAALTTAAPSAPPTSIFSVPATTDAKPEVPKANAVPSLFGNVSTATTETKPASLFGNVSTATTETKPASNLFNFTAPAISKPSLFSGNAAPTSIFPPGPLFNAAPTASAEAKPAGIFNFVAPTATLGANTTVASAASSAIATTAAPLFTSGATAPSMFSFGGLSKPEEKAATATSSAPSIAPGPAFSFGGMSTATAPSISAPAVPQTPGPFSFGSGLDLAKAPNGTTNSFSFTGPPGANPFAPTASSPTKSPGFLRNNTTEDISMASPEQSPQKQQSPRPNFGMSTNSQFTPGKSFNFADSQFSAISSGSPLKFGFGASQLDNSTVQFGPPITAPGSTTPAAAPTLPGNPGEFKFNSLPSFGASTTPASATPTATPAPALGASGFQFNTNEIDFSLASSPSNRRIATPRGRRPGGKR